MGDELKYRGDQARRYVDGRGRERVADMIIKTLEAKA
jgi:hypothetical protein